MSKFIFQKLPDDSSYHSPDLTEIKLTTEHNSLPELLQEFKNFLSACGFIIPAGAELDLTDEEDDEEFISRDRSVDLGDELRESVRTKRSKRGCPPT